MTDQFDSIFFSFLSLYFEDCFLSLESTEKSYANVLAKLENIVTEAKVFPFSRTRRRVLETSFAPGNKKMLERWNIQLDTSVGQRKNLSPRRESNP